MRFFLLIALLFSYSAMAEEKLAFTLSGGVSLGSYEAGVFHELIQQDREAIRSKTKVVFGASAGSINGLFGIMDICGFHSADKEDSLLWKMWIPRGLNELETQDKKVLSLLDRNSI